MTTEKQAGKRRIFQLGPDPDEVELDRLVPDQAREWVEEDRQTSIPKIAKDERSVQEIERTIQEQVPSRHEFILQDCREGLAELDDNSVQLVLTSPPYWSLKEYNDPLEAQLGHIEDYEAFLSQIERVWTQIHRVLEPGGRLIIVVGDVCLSRREFGRHVVFPLHASIQEQCRNLGFDNLAPIIWYKIANAQFESGGGGGFLGKPYEPNAIVKNDVEYILFQRIPNGYRKPSVPQRVLSTIPREAHQRWFQQVWRITGASSQVHPAPFPVQLAERLIRMFSFVGDTVLDPFLGTGSTSVAAARWGRNSIGYEIQPEYFDHAVQRVQESYEEQLSLVP